MRPKPVRTFTVRAELPEELAPLLEVAMNLRWSWDQRSRDLFRWVDPKAWEASGHEPVRLLSMVGRDRLEALVGDPSFLAFVGEIHNDLRHLMERPRWFQGRPRSLRSVAYFSPEFGLDRALPQYSGGLGVLAGDHLKAAGALGVPIVGVGLFYRQGYFRQELSPEGWQQERYATLDPHGMPLNAVAGVRISVDLAGTAISAGVWRAQVGRVPLYLLDASLEENDEAGRAVTDRLYGGWGEHRLRQEILLGVGGIRALDAMGDLPQVFHINEGHAGFLLFERIRRLVATDGLTFPEAVEAVRSSTVFTTHTPVGDGIDRFPRDLMERYFRSTAEACGVTFDELMALGVEPGDASGSTFNMAVFALRLSGGSNGVSRLHGRVSRQMFEHLWPEVPIDEIPIGSITNGVHARTWVSAEMADLFDHHVLPEWYEADEERWARIADARDEDVWRIREQGRERLVAFVRGRLKASGLAKGVSESDLAWCDDVLDPQVLTIGFARRFAAYKRATLLLSQPERLRALLTSPTRPVQLVFAGKAHPADEIGKQMIRQIVEFSRDPAVRHRVVFLEDYDMEVARMLYQGADLWLNTPRRPLEACGTSGEKAALNGSLQCSILDGWWDEMYDGENGWAVASAESYEDLERRDQAEASSLFDLLERHVVPLFYHRANGSIPREWVRRIKISLRTLGPRVSASRMVREYVEHMYEPAAAQTERLSAGGLRGARALAAWKERIRKSWGGVVIESARSEVKTPALGVAQRVDAVVRLGELGVENVEVQLVHGPMDVSDELQEISIEPMAPDRAPAAGAATAGVYCYRGSFTCKRTGRYGFTVRVVPAHPDLVTYAEVGCVTWA